MKTVGRCRCAQVTFELHAAPLITSACHCTGCQQMSASAFSLTALFPADALMVTRGEPVIGGLHCPTRHLFCPHCLTWLFTRPAGNEAVIGVRSSLLDEPAQYAPFMETWTAEQLPWARTGAQVSFDAFPEPGEYPELMKRFAQHWQSR